MADQTLHGGLRGAGRRRRDASIAVVGSIALHALALGYLALLGLSTEDDRWPDPISDPIFPYNVIPVELIPRPSGTGLHVRRSRVMPNNHGTNGTNQPAERSPDFHFPEPGRAPVPGGRPLDARAETGSTGSLGSRVGPFSVREGARPAPFSGTARTSTLACRTLAGTLTFEEQAVCDTRFGQAAALSRPISGTGDPAQDGRFAAEGQAELDAYEALRAPLKPPTPCEGADMMGRCPAIITIPLISRKF